MKRRDFLGWLSAAPLFGALATETPINKQSYPGGSLVAGKSRITGLSCTIDARKVFPLLREFFNGHDGECPLAAEADRQSDGSWLVRVRRCPPRPADLDIIDPTGKVIGTIPLYTHCQPAEVMRRHGATGIVWHVEHKFTTRA